MRFQEFNMATHSCLEPLVMTCQLWI